MSTPQELLSQAHPVEVDRITKKEDEYINEADKRQAMNSGYATKLSSLNQEGGYKSYSQKSTMSTPGVNPALDAQITVTKSDTPTVWGGMLTILAALGGVFGFLLHAAAAKLSYDKYGSIGWAILDFFFGAFYIPYYAFVLNTPTAAPTMGGRPRRR
jgi:hypothetical protein